jgi:GNAT superfamily N-acetyltransferase
MPEIEVDGRRLAMRRVELADVIDLRHQVLREGLPREEAVFEGDAGPTARHYAAVELSPGTGGRVRTVCCATFHLNAWAGETAWQLRGMATAPDLRGRGVGRALMEWAEQDLRQAAPVRLLWCNARVPALSFYLAQGWEIRSEIFDIPTAGPHHKLTKRLD